MLQQQRDFGRMRIVQNELNTAQQRLMKLQMEYNNGQPERIGNEKIAKNTLTEWQAWNKTSNSLNQT